MSDQFKGEILFCNKCGFKLLSNSKFCSKCGAPILVMENNDKSQQVEKVNIETKKKE